jgi:hypothetical protein
MINFKSFKWGYGIVVSLVFGLSGCYMDGQNPQYVDYSSQNTIKTGTGATSNAGNTKVATKKYASKEPIQKATPGPKQTAAPQLPVIQ